MKTTARYGRLHISVVLRAVAENSTHGWLRQREKNDMTKGTKNHGLQKVVGLLVERSVVGDDDAYLTGEI